MINLNVVGAHATDAPGSLAVDFGVYLPGITFGKGYRVKVLVIHESDQFVHDIDPVPGWLTWNNGSEYDLWNIHFLLDPERDNQSRSHFGSPGRYLYRFQLLREPVSDPASSAAITFADPFGREAGTGTLSAFEVPVRTPAFRWAHDDFTPPSVDEMVVYELNVHEFNEDFAGVADQLNYLKGLGVNVLELMPVTNIAEEVEWGYTPLGYFSPNQRFGGVEGLKKLVDASHGEGIAVILDAVYAHSHIDFAYNVLYDLTGEPNPMMGKFAGEYFPPTTIRH